MSRLCLNRIPQDYHRYFEPFLGGGAVYFHMEPEQAVVGDVNPKQIKFYQQLRDNYPLMQKQFDQLCLLYTSQKVIICAGCPIFVYGGAISALPGTFSLVTAVRFSNG